MAEAFTFSIGRDGDVTVRSYPELLGWLEKERARWAWMVPGDGRTDRHNLAAELQNQWNTLIGNVQSLANQGQTLEYTRQYLAPLTNSLIMVSTTQDGATVLDIRDSAGDVAGMAALGFLKQRLTAANTPLREEMLGLMLSVFPDLRSPADWTDRLKRERTNFRMATRSLIERVEADAANRDEAARELANRLRAIARRMFVKRRQAWRETQNEWELSAAESVAQVESRAGNAVESIKSTESTYRQFMQLKAPVEYWQAKATGHKTREKSARKLLYWYFPITTCVMCGVFAIAGNFILSHPDTTDAKSPVALYIVLSGGLLLLSTLAFWIGRLLTKLYLSEHHLRNDAEERATMTTTYLALTGESAAAETERQIILSALFRPTPDGIVKEDGPGDIGLQGVLAKFMMK